LIVLAGLFLASFTWQRNQLWRNQELLWRDAVKKSPQFFRPANNYCSILSELGKCEEAIHACKMSLSLGPNPESYNNLAVCYAKTGRDDLAEKSLRTAAALGNESAISFYNLGMTRLAKHDYQGSLKWFLIAVEKDPFYANAHFQLAHAYVNLGRRDDYMRELQETIKLRPELTAARVELGWALVGEGKCEEAMELVKSAPAQDPQLSNILEHCRSR
jgi:tetratricopeptide (TPR) repeat protein